MDSSGHFGDAAPPSYFSDVPDPPSERGSTTLSNLDSGNFAGNNGSTMRLLSSHEEIIPGSESPGLGTATAPGSGVGAGGPIPVQRPYVTDFHHRTHHYHHHSIPRTPLHAHAHVRSREEEEEKEEREAGKGNGNGTCTARAKRNDALTLSLDCEAASPLRRLERQGVKLMTERQQQDLLRRQEQERQKMKTFPGRGADVVAGEIRRPAMTARISWKAARKESSADDQEKSALSQQPSACVHFRSPSPNNTSPAKSWTRAQMQTQAKPAQGVSGNAPRIRARVTLRRKEARQPNFEDYSQPTRYHRPSAGPAPASRSGSSLGQAPNIPPPVADMHPYAQTSSGRSSPTRPWTPSSRPPPAETSYEPADINGSPRPGTPSSKYGGSPRRPLPPAPLFAASASSRHSKDMAEETTIPINSDNEDDVFGEPSPNPRASLKSYNSYMTDSTFTEETEDKEDVGHYGPAPDGPQGRRGARTAQVTKREVRLINGELILECKIPTILHSFLPRRDEVEFTHMRYTAVTCDPDDFVLNGYKLRQNIGRTMRETELFICVTMYNEDEIHFTRTMHGIMRNITHFCSRTKSRTWGKDGWEKIVVCIISDGRQKVHPRTLNALAAMGVYQEGIAKNIVNQKEVTAHVYEYTTQVSLDSDLKFKGAEKGIVPCQMIFCLKEKNQKKLNSHRWFFNAFGRALSPNVCILLDVGTKPAPTALYHLWKAFDQDSNVAGAAGEIKAGKGRAWLGLLNPLVASQNFEYKLSNILDKPLESVFGYITVLPGALSAYRYYALQNDPTGHGPLSQYFKGETLHGQDADVFTANMYLAEDRILCWELVAKRDEQWVLKFVKSAVGETDVPDSVPEFISQRRRWLNGAFFAAVYSLIHFRQVWRTDHTLTRKVLLHIEFVYQFISLMFTYFSLANFYLTFFFIAGSLADPKLDPFGHSIGKAIFNILRYACVLLICLQFILSMGNRPQGAKKMFLSTMIVFCIIMGYTTFCALYVVILQFTARSDSDSDDIAIGNNVFTNLVVSTCSTIGLYFLMSFLYLDPWHMFTSSAQYFALLPSYICTLQVYAFCNTHDVTWGTKGDNVIHTDLGAAQGKGKGGSIVELEMPSEQLDIDSGYDAALRNLRDRVEVPPPPMSEYQAQEDYYRAVRTYMVAVWMIANAILAMTVSEAYTGSDISNNFYLTFILWSVAAVALFRALGSSAFGIINLVGMVMEGRLQMGFQRRVAQVGDGMSSVGEKVSSLWSSSKT